MEKRSGVLSGLIGVGLIVLIIVFITSLQGGSFDEVITKVVVFVVVIGIILAVAITFGVFYLARRLYYALKGDEYVPLIKPKKRAYVHLDPDAGTDAHDIDDVLRRYTNLDIVGKYAKSARNTLASSKRRYDSFFAVLDAKFDKSTISWDKFAVAADSTEQAILHNCATVGNTVQMFDRDEYRRLARLYRMSAQRPGPTTTDLDNQKWWLMQQNLRNMDAIIVANDQLLFELDKLTAELNKLNDVDASEAGDRLLAEIRTLIEETKYYQQAQSN